MKMSFFPGKLFLEQAPDGAFDLRFGDEVQRFRSQKSAVKAFLALRSRLEKDFPSRELSPEERRNLFVRDVVDSAVGHNTLRNAGPKKKTGTRTFG